MLDPHVQHRIASYLKWRIAVRGSMTYFAVRRETHGMSPPGTQPRCAAVQQVVGCWKCCGPSAPLGRTTAHNPQWTGRAIARAHKAYTFFATNTTDSQPTIGRGTCGRRQRQISKARQTSIGSAFVLRPRYLAVLSILAWPKSARTVCKSPVPFKMWRAFVRRKDSTP